MTWLTRRGRHHHHAFSYFVLNYILASLSPKKHSTSRNFILKIGPNFDSPLVIRCLLDWLWKNTHFNIKNKLVYWGQNSVIKGDSYDLLVMLKRKDQTNAFLFVSIKIIDINFEIGILYSGWKILENQKNQEYT